jgi:hypothetical protein
MKADNDFVWSVADGVMTLNGHIVLTMPLRPGLVEGRTHTASCTLCRGQQLAAHGRKTAGIAGTLGWFKSRELRDTFVKQHVAVHKKRGEEVHIVNLPEVVPALTAEGAAGGGQGL